MRSSLLFAAAVVVSLLAACGGPAEQVAAPTTDVVTVEAAEGHALAAPRRLAQATVPAFKLHDGSEVVPARVAQRCGPNALPPGTVSLAAAWAGRGVGFYAITEGSTHATLNRLSGSGCQLSPWVGYFRTEVTVTSPLLAAGRLGYAFLVRDGAVEEVSAAGVQTTAGPFRNVTSLAVSPSERRMVVTSCGAWQVLERRESSWVEHGALTQAVRAVEATGRALLLDDERVAIVEANGDVSVVTAAGPTVKFNTALEGEAPSPDSFALCSSDAGTALSARVLCLSYPQRGVSARWSGDGRLLDLVTVEGLAPGQRVVGVVKDLGSNSGVHVLLMSAAGASLAYLPEP